MHKVKGTLVTLWVISMCVPLWTHPTCRGTCNLCTGVAICQELPYIPGESRSTRSLVLTHSSVFVVVTRPLVVPALRLLKLLTHDTTVARNTFQDTSGHGTLLLGHNGVTGQTMRACTHTWLQRLERLKPHGSSCWFWGPDKLWSLHQRGHWRATLQGSDVAPSSLLNPQIRGLCIHFTQQLASLSWRGLRRLALTGNRLAALPSTFSTLSRLSVLKLDQWPCACQLRHLATFLQELSKRPARSPCAGSGLACGTADTAGMRMVQEMDRNVTTAPSSGQEQRHAQGWVLTLLLFSVGAVGLTVGVVIVLHKKGLCPRERIHSAQGPKSNQQRARILERNPQRECSGETYRPHRQHQAQEQWNYFACGHCGLVHTFETVASNCARRPVDKLTAQPTRGNGTGNLWDIRQKLLQSLEGSNWGPQARHHYPGHSSDLSGDAIGMQSLYKGPWKWGSFQTTMEKPVTRPGWQPCCHLPVSVASTSSSRKVLAPAVVPFCTANHRRLPIRRRQSVGPWLRNCLSGKQDYREFSGRIPAKMSRTWSVAVRDERGAAGADVSAELQSNMVTADHRWGIQVTSDPLAEPMEDAGRFGSSQSTGQISIPGRVWGRGRDWTPKSVTFDLLGLGTELTHSSKVQTSTRGTPVSAGSPRGGGVILSMKEAPGERRRGRVFSLRVPADMLSVKVILHPTREAKVTGVGRPSEKKLVNQRGKRLRATYKRGQPMDYHVPRETDHSQRPRTSRRRPSVLPQDQHGRDGAEGRGWDWGSPFGPVAGTHGATETPLSAPDARLKPQVAETIRPSTGLTNVEVMLPTLPPVSGARTSTSLGAGSLESEEKGGTRGRSRTQGEEGRAGRKAPADGRKQGCPPSAQAESGSLVWAGNSRPEISFPASCTKAEAAGQGQAHCWGPVGHNAISTAKPSHQRPGEGEVQGGEGGQKREEVQGRERQQKREEVQGRVEVGTDMVVGRGEPIFSAGPGPSAALKTFTIHNTSNLSVIYKLADLIYHVIIQIIDIDNK
ncbi:uncharacterized protein lrrc53 [Narcine bancroftii]|uniref:uncharacterized protein lrrc53 n=1 Tax=Narcine bancroftii TaxID=1343680 RepID=UPI00383190E2